MHNIILLSVCEILGKNCIVRADLEVVSWMYPAACYLKVEVRLGFFSERGHLKSCIPNPKELILEGGGKCYTTNHPTA